MTVEGEATLVGERRSEFRVTARDDVAVVSEGAHERFAIDDLALAGSAYRRFRESESGARSGE